MPPPGTLGLVDLRTIEQQSSPGVSMGVGFFATQQDLSPAYTLLGQGDCRELASTPMMRDIFAARVGYRPNGQTLCDLLWDVLTQGSDPTGMSQPRPMMPMPGGMLELHLGGHSLVKSAPFRWGDAPTAKIQELLRLEFRQHFDDADQGRIPPGHHRRVLDYWCEKYRLQGKDEWKQFVPTDLHKHVPGRLKHATTISDEFTAANGTILYSHSGGGFTWTEVRVLADDPTIVSNQLQANGSTFHFARAESDLSSDDMLTECIDCNFGSTSVSNSAGAIARIDGNLFAAVNMYNFRHQGNNSYVLQKYVAGTVTNLATGSVATTANERIGCSANGSTVDGQVNSAVQASVTDTSVVGFTRSGLMIARIASMTMGSWQAADQASAGTPQLFFRKRSNSLIQR